MSEPKPLNEILEPHLRHVSIASAELARLRKNSERWEWAKACAVDEDDGGFILYPETAFMDRDYDPDAEAFEAAVDAAIAAERGAGK